MSVTHASVLSSIFPEPKRSRTNSFRPVALYFPAIWDALSKSFFNLLSYHSHISIDILTWVFTYPYLLPVAILLGYMKIYPMKYKHVISVLTIRINSTSKLIFSLNA